MEHEGGYGNIITDLGSRDMWPELRAVCASYGITLKEVAPPPSFMALALEIENGTSDFYEEAPK
eukprot:7384546-Prymnesium_polylepis.1